MLNSTRSKSLFDEVEVMKNRIHLRAQIFVVFLIMKLKGFLCFVVDAVNIVLDNLV